MYSTAAHETYVKIGSGSCFIATAELCKRVEAPFLIPSPLLSNTVSLSRVWTKGFLLNCEPVLYFSGPSTVCPRQVHATQKYTKQIWNNGFMRRGDRTTKIAANRPDEGEHEQLHA